jgi:short-subunit dehydrogenase
VGPGTAEDPFRDNVAIITGASSGIGRALARRLAHRGARLVLAARDAAKLDAAAAECRAAGAAGAVAVPTDVAVERDCEYLVRAAVDAFGRVDTLVNNAGVSMWARFDELRDLRALEQVMRVNYFGAVYCTRYALPYLTATHGRIVAVSSLAGRAGVPTRSGYAASKHAMAGFFDSLRIELAPLGVSVTVAYPGFVATEVRERAFGPDGGPLARSPVREKEVMTAERCAELIERAAALRKREVVMTTRGKLGQWLKLIAPGLVDRVAARAIARGK